MAKRIFLCDIDLAFNQLLSTKLQNLPSDPSPAESQIYYNTVIKKIKYYSTNTPNNLNPTSTWRTVVDDLDLAIARTPASHVIATESGLGEQHTISATAAGHVLVSLGTNTAKMAKLLHGQLGDIGTNAHSAIDTHIGASEKHRLINDADTKDSGTATTSLFSAQKILTLITDLNTAITGSLIFKGGYNMITDFTDTSGANIKIQTPTAGQIKQGWTYVITAIDGTHYKLFSDAGSELAVGDMLIAKQSNPTGVSHWTIVNKNIPDIVAASENTLGIIQLATQAEVTAGSNTTKAVTPATLKGLLGTTGTLSAVRKYTQQIGDGNLLTFAVVHGLGNQIIISQVRRTLSPFDQVECEVVSTSSTTVTFNFNIAPSLNQYTVTIIG